MSIPNCTEVFRELQKLAGERDALLKSKEQAETRISVLDTEIADLEKVSSVLKKLVETTAHASIEQLTGIVSAGLRDIFYDQDIVFSAKYLVKQGKPKLDLCFVVDGEERSVDLVGGGVIGVTSILLRIVELKLYGLVPILLTDEPLVHLSAKYLPGAAKFIRGVAKKFGISILMVSHQKEMSQNSDRVIEASMSEEGLNVVEVCNE